ncbi:MAG: hypothetical protein DLM62_04915 [Pseudonocardiales bacterium]|nr:MAG: hypothetical protein DLM62_04915 [Pseudonocardiales bacterium]
MVVVGGAHATPWLAWMPERDARVTDRRGRAAGTLRGCPACHNELDGLNWLHSDGASERRIGGLAPRACHPHATGAASVSLNTSLDRC